MLRIYKNALLQEILVAGFDRSRFKSESNENDRDHPAFEITFEPNPQLWFELRNPKDDFHKFDFRYSEFAPGFPWPADFSPASGYCAFDGALAAFRRWLDGDVRLAMEDLAVPDLWQLVSSASASTSIATRLADDQSQFSEEEREQIRLSLQRFRVLIIQNFGPTPTEMAAIEAQLDYLSRAVDRLNRFDWKGTALNTVLGITVTLSLDVERGRQLWGLFQQAFEIVLQLIR